MWLLVMYDIPVTTESQRKGGAKFRKELLNDGFNLFQFSIYSRYCSSSKNITTHKKRIKNKIPKDGRIAIISITDEQYDNIDFFTNTIKKNMFKTPQQFEIY